MHLCFFQETLGEDRRQLAPGIFSRSRCQQFSTACFPTVPWNSWARTFPILGFSPWRDAIWFISQARWTNCCCLWAYLYASCWRTEETAACTICLPLDNPRCCWSALGRTRPLSPSARTLLWYSIQNKMPYVNERTLLAVTSCVGFLWAWESLLNWSQRALQPSASWLTSAANLHCLLMRVRDLQASNFRLLSLLCQWTRCNIP